MKVTETRPRAAARGIPGPRLSPLWPVAVAALLLFGVLAPARADSPCPTSAVAFFGNPDVPQTAAAFDSIVDVAPDCRMRTAYDLRAGTTLMQQCGFLGFTSVRASDTFDVIGVPAGTPVQVTAEYEVDSGVYVNGECSGSGCCGRVVLRLQQGALFDERTHIPTLYSGRADFHDLLALPVTIIAGEPVTFDCILEGNRCAGGEHGSEATGTLRFTGLPAGVRVVSCRSFGGVTHARARSWGQLKLLYR